MRRRLPGRRLLPFYLDLSSIIRGRGRPRRTRVLQKEKARAGCLRLFLVYIFRLSKSAGKSHGFQLYFLFAIRELRGIEGKRGLDKISPELGNGRILAGYDFSWASCFFTSAAW